MSGDDPAPAGTVERVLAACPLPLREARALLAHCLGCERETLIAHPALAVDAAALACLEAAVARRTSGMPMAYLLGYQEFYGHRLQVTPGVLVPRPETELLVDTALGLLAPGPGARILELGTGSGAIAIALALARPGLRVVASDRSPAALGVAQDNCRRLGAQVLLVLADWYTTLGEPPQPAALAGPFALIVSNPPYVRADDPHLRDLAFEPRGALVDDAGDGLSGLDAVVSGAAARLAPGGHVLVEHGYDQGDAVRALMRARGLGRVRTLQDLEGRDRACVGGA